MGKQRRWSREGVGAEEGGGKQRRGACCCEVCVRGRGKITQLTIGIHHKDHFTDTKKLGEYPTAAMLPKSRITRLSPAQGSSS